MKKKIVIIFIFLVLFACSNTEENIIEPKSLIQLELGISGSNGIKLESNFATTEVKINVKLASDEVVNIKMIDLLGRVVSSGELKGNKGDNVFSIYTKALPRSSYEIQVYNSNNQQIGRTLINLL
jgi:hypothetical protein